MTEFDHLGSFCHYCHTKDYLPFKCPLCGNSFCKEHRDFDQHDCPEAYRAQRKIVACPICQTGIPIPEGANPDEIMDSHMRSKDCHPNSNKEDSSSLPLKVIKCSMEQCDNDSMITCSKCGKRFCLDHRLDFDHHCGETKKSTGSSKQSVDHQVKSNPIKLYYQQQNEKLKQIRLENEQKKKQLQQNLSSSSKIGISSTTTNTVQHLPSHKNATALVLGRNQNNNKSERSKAFESAFENSKMKPVGQSSIEPDDRFTIDMFFPVTSHHKPTHMYFHRNWKVGKVLDHVCRYGKINNENAHQLDPEKRLQLFHLRNGYALPNDQTLEELKEDGVLMPGDPVILEVGTFITEKILLDFENAESSLKNSDDIKQCMLS